MNMSKMFEKSIRCKYYLLSKILRRSLMVFIIKGFQTIVFILIVISTMFRGFNKGPSSKFREDSQVRQTPKEGRRTYRPKCWGNNNKDEDNCPKTLNDKVVNIFLCVCVYGFSCDIFGMEYSWLRNLFSGDNSF